MRIADKHYQVSYGPSRGRPLWEAHGEAPHGASQGSPLRGSPWSITGKPMVHYGEAHYGEGHGRLRAPIMGRPVVQYGKARCMQNCMCTTLGEPCTSSPCEETTVTNACQPNCRSKCLFKSCRLPVFVFGQGSFLQRYSMLLETCSVRL